MKKPLKKTGTENPGGKKKPLTGKVNKLEEKKLEKYKKQTLLNTDEDEDEDRDDPDMEDLNFELDDFDDFDEEDEDY
jgi:hypothetical protein